MVKLFKTLVRLYFQGRGRYHNCLINDLRSNKAFSMAEALITLSLIGVIAAILIPSLQNHSLDTKRVKIKKAVEVYSNAVIMMVSENDLKTNAKETLALDNWAKKNDCANALQYFKIIERGSVCQFKTADGLWWDIGSDKDKKMSKTIVAFKKADLKKSKAIDESSNDAFYFMAQFDTKQKARIFDVKYSNYVGWSANIINNAKVYAFINKKKMSDYYNFCGECANRDKKECKSCITKTCTKNGSTYYCTLEYHNQNGILTSYRSNCTNDAVGCTVGQYKATPIGGDNAFAGNCDSQGADCGYYIMHYDYVKDWKTKGDTPDFDTNGEKVTETDGETDKHYYSQFKKYSENIKYTDCDFYADSIDKCHGNTNNVLAYYIPDDPNNTFMSVYYTVDKNGNKVISSIGISDYRNNSQAAIGQISYSNCSGWDISTCKYCRSYNPSEYPCP